MNAGRVAELASGVLASEPRAVARAIRLADDRMPDGLAVLKSLYRHTGHAWVLGITGNPGAGKSTLCDGLIRTYRARGQRVGVVAVDPSSPFTGGAILGDRIRMARHTLDDGVFIRSLATRGHLGGLSRSARDAVRILDAARYDVILVETVGVGQDELEIVRTAHTTLVVVAPGLGDHVQAFKAGLLECADVFAVNKSDREGAAAAARDLELMLALGRESSPPSEQAASFTPKIVCCAASTGAGVAEVAAACDDHREWLAGTERGRARRLARGAEELRESLREALIEAAVGDLGPMVEHAARAVAERQVDPYTATEALVSAFRARVT